MHEEIIDPNEEYVVLQVVMQWFFLNCSKKGNQILKPKDNTIQLITELLRKTFKLKDNTNKIKLSEELFF